MVNGSGIIQARAELHDAGSGIKMTLDELKAHIKQLEAEVKEKGWEAVYNTPVSRKRLEEAG